MLGGPFCSALLAGTSTARLSWCREAYRQIAPPPQEVGGGRVRRGSACWLDCSVASPVNITISGAFAGGAQGLSLWSRGAGASQLLADTLSRG